MNSKVRLLWKLVVFTITITIGPLILGVLISLGGVITIVYTIGTVIVKSIGQCFKRVTN